MELNDLTYKVRGTIFTVFNESGPGLLESVYSASLRDQESIIRIIN
ncbi:MAG: GxxExxY protein [Cyclobacteriaceae bacterium]